MLLTALVPEVQPFVKSCPQLLVVRYLRKAAIEFCERIRSAIEVHDWHAVHRELRMTVSIGVWQWDGSTDSAALIEAAASKRSRHPMLRAVLGINIISPPAPRGDSARGFHRDS